MNTALYVGLAVVLLRAAIEIMTLRVMSRRMAQDLRLTATRAVPAASSTAGCAGHLLAGEPDGPAGRRAYLSTTVTTATVTTARWPR